MGKTHRVARLLSDASSAPWVVAAAVLLLVWFPLGASNIMSPGVLHVWNLVHDIVVAGLLVVSIPLLVGIVKGKALVVNEGPLLFLIVSVLSLIPLLSVPTLGIAYVRMHAVTLSTFGALFLCSRWVSGKNPKRVFFLFVTAWSSWAVVSAVRGLGRIASVEGGFRARLDIMGHSNSRAGFELLIFLLIGGMLLSGNRRYRFLFLPALVLLALSIGLSLSRGAWMGFAGGVIVLAGVKFRWRWAAALCLILVLVFLMLPGTLGERARTGLDLGFSTNIFRMTVWKEVVGIIAENPWGGCGYDTLWFAASTRLSPDGSALAGRHVHNLVLQIWAEVGILGLLALCLVFVSLLRAAVEVNNSEDDTLKGIGFGMTAALAGILVHGIVDFTWRDYQQQILFWSLAGWLAAYSSKRRAAAAESWREVRTNRETVFE